MTPPKPLYVRIAHAPAMFGIGRTMIYEMASAGKLTIYKAGNASLLKVEEMEAVIQPRPTP